MMVLRDKSKTSKCVDFFERNNEVVVFSTAVPVFELQSDFENITICNPLRIFFIISVAEEENGAFL